MPFSHLYSVTGRCIPYDHLRAAGQVHLLLTGATAVPKEDKSSPGARELFLAQNSGLADLFADGIERPSTICIVHPPDLKRVLRGQEEPLASFS